jgi:uncharacterized membrane protein YesL
MDGLGGVEHSHWNYNWFSKLKIALIFIFILMLCIRMYTKSLGSYGVIAYWKKTVLLLVSSSNTGFFSISDNNYKFPSLNKRVYSTSFGDEVERNK